MKRVAFLFSASVLIALLCGVAFVVGVVFGVGLGGVNTRTDFCFDETSGRFIDDPWIREKVCHR